MDYLWYLVEDFFSSYFIPVNKYTQDYTCPAFSICQVHTFSRSVSQKTRCLLDNSVACTFSLIKMSSPNINNIMAVGCIMCYACVFLLGADSLLDHDSQITTHSTLCKVRNFLSSFSSSLSTAGSDATPPKLLVMPVDDLFYFFVEGS